MKWFLALAGLVMLALAGCDSGNTGTGTAAQNENPPALHEREFARDPGFFAKPDQVVIINLEHPGDAADPLEDTGSAGTDRIPIWYPGTLAHEFRLEVREGDLFSLMIYNNQGRELLFLDKDNPVAGINLAQGLYTLELRHGGGTDDPRTLFIRPGSTRVGYDCAGCFLRNHDFRSANLREANLSGADLSEADLTGADLTGANLTDAKMEWAILSGATLFVATINGADLTSADLSGADLSYVMLGYDKLKPVMMSHANLMGANLHYADLRSADLRHADLTGADLSYAELRRAILDRADLTGAGLSNAGLANASLIETNLSHADLSHARLMDADLRNADLTGANLTGADLSSAAWIDGRICGNPSIGSCN